MPRVMPWMIALCAAVAVAQAQPAPGPGRGDPTHTDAPRRDAPPTLVLVAPPPSVLDAVTAMLGPWQVKIVVIGATTDAPAAIAATHGAAFVAVTRARSLELHDRDTGVSQVRLLPEPLDDAEAVAVALSIKTWMRLGAPPTTAPLVEPRRIEAPPPPPPPARPWHVGAELGLGARGNQAARASGLRGTVAVSAGYRWSEVTVSADVGTSFDPSDSDATDWSQREYAIRAGGRLELAPLWLNAGLGLAWIQSTIVGVQTGSGRVSTRTDGAAGLHGAVGVGWRWRGWQVGATVGATQTLSSQNIGPFQLSVDAHIEPWFTLGGGWRWP